MAKERELRALLRLGIDKKSIGEVKRGIKSVEKDLDDLADEGEKSFDKTGKAGVNLGNVISGAIGGAVVALTGAFANLASQGVDALKQIGAKAIEVNTQFETLTTQFTTLLQGDQAGAQNLIQQLQQFNLATPFELDQLAEGAKLLQTFGGEALNTAENWSLVGDAAASVNQPFERAAFWIGRLYSNLEAGRPFGEAAMSLQEMGIMSGTLRTKLEDMQKAGADGMEIWAMFSEEIGGTFAGGAERLSKTLTGIQSNLNDFNAELLRVGGEPLFEAIKEDSQELLDILSDEEMSGALKELSESVGIFAANAQQAVTSGFFEALEGIDTESVEGLAGAIQDAGESLGGLSSVGEIESINTLVELLTTLIDSATLFSRGVDEVSESSQAAGVAVGFFGDSMQDTLLGALLPEPLFNLVNGFERLNNATDLATGSTFTEWMRGATDATSAQTEAQEELAEQYAELNQARAAGIAKMEREAEAEKQRKIDEATAAQKEYADALEKVNEAYGDLDRQNRRQVLDAEIDRIRELADLTEEFNRKRQDAEDDYRQERFDTVEDANQELMEIERDYILDVLDAEERFSQQRQDIAEKNADSIADIHRRAAQRIADASQDMEQGQQDIERDTERDLADVDRELAQERIDIEINYQREIRRIRQQFATTAEEAVRNQDAIGFLRAKRQQEQALQEAKQNRNDNLQDARTNAQRRREEIRIQREQELEDERIANERKMEELRIQLERELQEQRIQHEREMEQQRQEEERKLEQLAQAKDREIQQANQKTAQKLQDLAEEYSEEQALIDEQEEQKREKIEQGHARELEDLNRHYQQRKSDIQRHMADELQIVQRYMQQIQQALSQSLVGNRGGGIPGLQGGLPLSGLPVGIGRRASGGYAGSGIYALGEQGKEFVMSNPVTEQMERAFGTLTQDKMQRIGDMAMSNTFNFSERDDARQILGQVEQIVNRQLVRMERGY